MQMATLVSFARENASCKRGELFCVPLHALLNCPPEQVSKLTSDAVALTGWCIVINPPRLALSILLTILLPSSASSLITLTLTGKAWASWSCDLFCGYLKKTGTSLVSFMAPTYYCDVWTLTSIKKTKWNKQIEKSQPQKWSLPSLPSWKETMVYWVFKKFWCCSLANRAFFCEES